MFIYRFDTQLISIFSFFSRIPCSSRQLRLEYCSCFSTDSERSSTFCVNLAKFSVKLFMISSLSFLSCSYLSNFLVIKYAASLSSCRWLLPLICFCFSSLVLSNICYLLFAFPFSLCNSVIMRHNLSPSNFQ